MTSTAARRAWIFGPLLALMLLMTGCNGELLPDKTSASSAAPSASAPASTTPPSQTPSPTNACDPKFKQIVIGNGTDGKAVEDFSKRFADVAATSDGTALSKEQQQRFLNLVASNAHLLAYYAYAFGLHGDPNNVDGLATANCLTEDGQTLYHQLEGVVLTATSTKDHANQNHYDSGIDKGKAVVAERPGIPSDTTAMTFKLKNGKEVTILIYCGNVVFETAPPIPTSPIVPQPPAPQPSTPQPPVYQPPQQPSCYPLWGIYPRCYGAKNPLRDPAPQGNTLNGGMNQNTGAGAVTIPQPIPAAPRQDPAQPAPQPAPVQGSGGTTIPAPNPNPVGTPRPTTPPVTGAPAPSQPASSCPIAPGMSGC